MSTNSYATLTTEQTYAKKNLEAGRAGKVGSGSHHTFSRL